MIHHTQTAAEAGRLLGNWANSSDQDGLDHESEPQYELVYCITTEISVSKYYQQYMLLYMLRLVCHQELSGTILYVTLLRRILYF